MKQPLIPSNWLQDNARNEKSNAITTLKTAPSKITLSENTSNFTFEPVKTGQNPTESVAVIQVAGYIAVGEEITIKSDKTSITLKASETPSSNGFYTESTTPLGPQLVPYLQTVAESIADTLNQSLSLFNNYTVTLFNSTVVVTANFADPSFDFTTLSSTSNAIVLINQQGTAEFLSQEQINYTAFCNVYVGSQLYDQPVSKADCIYVGTKLIDSSTQEANITVGAVGNYLNHILPLKSLSAYDGYYQMDKGEKAGGLVIPNEDEYGNVNLIMRPYFLEYGDKFSYVTNQTKKSYTKGVSEVRWMQLGSFDKLLPYDMSEYVWNTNNPFSFRWLTSCPNTKTVTYNSHEYLQVICKFSNVQQDFNLQVYCNFYDGTSTTVNKSTYNSKNIGGNISFDVSPTALDIKGIEQANGKNIDYYEVRLRWTYKGNQTGTSQLKRYKYDRNCYTDSKEVIFVNEYGAWDSLEFRGECIDTLDRSIDTIARALPFNANTDDSVSSEVSINITTDVTSEYTLNTGILPTEMLKWSKKLAESSAVFIWDNDYNKYRSIIVKDTSYVNDSVQTGLNLQMTFTYGTSNNTVKR